MLLYKPSSRVSPSFFSTLLPSSLCYLASSLYPLGLPLSPGVLALSHSFPPLPSAVPFHFSPSSSPLLSHGTFPSLTPAGFPGSSPHHTLVFFLPLPSLPYPRAALSPPLLTSFPLILASALSPRALLLNPPELGSPLSPLQIHLRNSFFR